MGDRFFEIEVRLLIRMDERLHNLVIGLRQIADHWSLQLLAPLFLKHLLHSLQSLEPIQYGHVYV